MTVGTGIAQLDHLMGGGYPSGRTLLMYGPPFCAKRLASRLFLVEGLRNGVPAILLTTDETAGDAKSNLRQIDPKLPDYEKDGLLQIIDAYSEGIGAAEKMPNVHYVDGVLNTNGLAGAVNDVQRELLKEHREHRLVLDSLSTFIAYSNAPAVFRFLQIFLGRAKAAGASTSIVLSQGMHSDEDVQMIEHLADGILEMRKDGPKNVMHLDGMGLTSSPGWVEYKYDQGSIDIIGSFAAGRIQ